MAKGTVRTTSTSSTGTSGIGVTITPPTGTTVGPSPTPILQLTAPTPLEIMNGTLTDNATQQTVNFQIAGGVELGIQTGSIVNYSTTTIGGQVVANTLRLLQKGEIMSINNDDLTGTLLEKGSGNTIQFMQVGATEMGLVAKTATQRGTIVHYETVISPISALPVALALEIV